MENVKPIPVTSPAEKGKKATGEIVKNIFKAIGTTLAIIALLISIATLFLLNKDGGRGLFGYKFFVVLSDSMRGTFSVGDVVISKEVSAETLKEGDIITFKSEDKNCDGAIVTHKIRSIRSTSDGPSFSTYGVATGADDEAPVSAGSIIGAYKTRIPKIGYLFNFVKTIYGYILFAFIPLMGMIISEIVKIVLMLRQHKKDKMEEYTKLISELKEENLRSRKIIENYNKTTENMG